MSPFLTSFIASFLLVMVTDSAPNPPSKSSGFGESVLEYASSSWASPDTVKAGQTFITNLPDSLGGLRVERFRGISLPATSWLLRRSFFWKTRVEDIGTHDLWFRAFLSDDSMDSVSVRVTVE